jgi:hypothetical protein
MRQSGRPLSCDRSLAPPPAGKPEEQVHFDIAHLNLITWKREELPELSQRLRNRIESVLGKGPRSQ